MRVLATAFALLAVVACSRTADRAGADTAAEVRRVWSGVDVDFLTGDVSPDGRSVSDANWTSGDLSLVDLATGEVRDLTGGGYAAGGYAWTSAFSPDGRQLAVSWYVDAAARHELRIVAIDGGASRVLVPAAAERYAIDPLDWSSSGDTILVATQAEGQWQLGLVSTESGALRIVKALGWQAPGGGHAQGYPDARLSPDGRFVAYDYPPDVDERNRDLHVFELETGREHTVVSGPASDRLLGWLPDGRGLLAYSDRSGTPAVWRVALRDGEAAGPPELVRASLPGLIPLGMTRDGFAYGVDVDTERIHTATIDPGTGALIQPPRPLDDSPSRKSLAADWSPDGRRVAYIVHPPWPDPAEILVIRAETGEEVRTMPLPVGIHTSSGTLRWVADQTVLAFAYDRGREGIVAIDLDSGRVTAVPFVTAGRAALKWFEAGPGGGTIYLVRPSPQGGGLNEFVVIDARTGRERVIAAGRAAPNSLAVAPDGEAVAYVARGDDPQRSELRITQSSSGETRTVYETARGTIGPPVAWSADAARLLFARPGEQDGRTLWSLAVRGRAEPVRLLPCCLGNDVRVHRDGRRLAFTAGTSRGELWMLTGF